MAKEKLKVKGTCFHANKNQNGSNIMIAANIENGPQGRATSREAVNIVVQDKEAAAAFTPGKSYTVTIAED